MEHRGRRTTTSSAMSFELGFTCADLRELTGELRSEPLTIQALRLQLGFQETPNLARVDSGGRVARQHWPGTEGVFAFASDRCSSVDGHWPVLKPLLQSRVGWANVTDHKSPSRLRVFQKSTPIAFRRSTRGEGNSPKHSGPEAQNNH